MNQKTNKIHIGSDPWAGALHTFLAERLRAWGYTGQDENAPVPRPPAEEQASVDGIPYYEAARRVACAISSTSAIGIVLCGTGMGVAMVANRFPGVRCALCETVTAAHRSRVFNNANCLALGQYFTTPFLAEEILRTFLETPFGAGVHPVRLDEIRRWHNEVAAIEKRLVIPDWKKASVISD